MGQAQMVCRGSRFLRDDKTDVARRRIACEEHLTILFSRRMLSAKLDEQVETLCPINMCSVANDYNSMHNNAFTEKRND